MKKSIFKRIGLIALAVCVAIGSFFVPLKSDKKLNSAHADSTTFDNLVFNGSNLLFARPSYANEPTITSFGEFLGGLSPYLNYSFRINVTTTGNSYAIKPTINAFSSTPTAYFGSGSSDYVGNGVTIFSNGSFSSSYIYQTFEAHLGDDPTYYSSFAFVSDCFISGSPSFSSDDNPSLIMSSVEIGSYQDFDILGYNSSLTGTALNVYNWITSHCNGNYNFVCYTDTNSFRYIFFLPTSSIDVLSSYRKYYLLNSMDFSDNQIFNQGYQQGLADNQQNIYNNGYNAGYDVGFGQGRQDGIVEANDYSFTSLISSVIDVPVKTFLGLFTFDFLGVNLADFLLGLLTFCVIIFVIKLLVGGK